MTEFIVKPIGFVRGGRKKIEDDNWGRSKALIELDQARFTPEALRGLAEFSHAEILFLFDRVSEEDVFCMARHPRGRQDWPKVGIFAQRAKNRPNRLGVSICEILHINGLSIAVEGLDAIDGTPVLDIKPVMSGFVARGELKEPLWAKEIMAKYWSE